MFESEDMIGVGLGCYFIYVFFFPKVIWLMSYKKNTCFSIYPFLYSSYGTFFFFLMLCFPKAGLMLLKKLGTMKTKQKNRKIDSINLKYYSPPPESSVCTGAI